MRYNRFVKSALSLVLVFALIISTFTMASAKTVAELEKEKQNIAADKNKVSNDLKDVREEKADEQKIFDELEGKMKKIESEMMDLTSEIDSYNQKIEVCQGEINALDAKIKESERQIIASQKVIKAKEDEFDEIFEVLKKRMRALYIAGDASALEILLTASDISDFLNRFELVQNVAEHDAELMRRVREIVTSLQLEKANLLDIKSRQETQKATQVAAKEKLNADKAVVEEKMSAKQEKQDEYQALINESNERMKEIKGRESELIKKEQQYAAQEDAIDSQIRDIINSNGSSSSGGGSSNGKVRFIWPVQGCSTYISSPYGPRWGTIHRGIDIAGGSIYGKPVVAAASGTVILALYTTTGYGRYVIVDHGNGYATLYAHCSELNVKVGQHVSQGQTIARVGSTGNSTGPHLHFEVRVNGERVNPMNYL